MIRIVGGRDNWFVVVDEESNDVVGKPADLSSIPTKV